MLQLIRDRAQGIVIWTIVGLIIITFALFGLSSYLSDAPKINVASVNGVEITQNDFARAYQNYQQRMQQVLGDNYRSDLFDNEKIKKEVLDALVNKELLKQELERAGFLAAPQQVMGQISNMKVFQDADGKFSADRYKQVLGSQRVNGFTFEQQVSLDLVEQQLRMGIMSSDFVTEQELQSLAKLVGQQRNADYLVLPLSRYMDAVRVSDADIDEYYAAHSNEYMTEEKVSVQYVELKLDDVAKGFDISESDVAQYYEQQRANYIKKPEQRKARHILIKVDATIDDSTAQSKIAEIKDKLGSGEPFEKLAEEYSQDIGSAKQGGDLGFFGRGVMDKAFEDAAFALSKAEVSAPVRSRFGYHLIKLDDISEPVISSLEEVSNTIKHDLQLQQAEQSYYSSVDSLNNLSYEIPDSLTQVAQEMGLELKTSGLFSRRGGEDIFSNQKIVTSVFSEEVLLQGRNSQLLDITDTHVIVLRIAEHVPSKQLEKEKVVSLIESTLKNVRASEQMEADKLKVLTQLKSGETPESVSKSLNLAWTKTGFINRGVNNNSLDPSIRTEIFQMRKPETGKPEFSSVRLNNGDDAIISLYEFKEGEPFKENKDGEKQKLIQVYSNAAETSLVNDLRKNADISLNLDAVQ